MTTLVSAILKTRNKPTTTLQHFLLNLQSCCLSEPNQAYTDVLQPVPSYLYYIYPQHTPSKSLPFQLSQFPSYIFAATLHFSSVLITHLLLKQFHISIYILIHLPPKLFIYLHFPLIYISFNLSYLLYNFYTFLFSFLFFLCFR